MWMSVDCGRMLEWLREYLQTNIYQLMQTPRNQGPDRESDTLFLLWGVTFNFQILVKEIHLIEQVESRVSCKPLSFPLVDYTWLHIGT